MEFSKFLIKLAPDNKKLGEGIKIKKEFSIEGMHCKSCAELIKEKLKSKVNSINVDFKRGKAVIEFNKKTVSEAKIREIINSMGYKVK